MEDGRVFERRMLPGLADVAPGGRVRLDGLARWMQDVAYADVQDAGVADAAVWVVRRMALRVTRFPRFAEPVIVRTACTGLGRAWAERTTTVAGDAGGDVEAVGLWVHLDPATQRPSPLTPEELAVYGSSAADRQVKARLRHPPPPAGARDAGPWRFRATDLDLMDHVNNAAYWQVLEEELLAGHEPAALRVELEYRTPAGAVELRVLRDDGHRWLVGEAGDVVASFAVAGP